jgi:hypothetical protein
MTESCRCFLGADVMPRGADQDKGTVVVACDQVVDGRIKHLPSSFQEGLGGGRFITVAIGLGPPTCLFAAGFQDLGGQGCRICVKINLATKDVHQLHKDSLHTGRVFRMHLIAKVVDMLQIDPYRVAKGGDCG